MALEQVIQPQMRLWRHHHVTQPVRRQSIGDDAHQFRRIRRQPLHLRTVEEPQADVDHVASGAGSAIDNASLSFGRSFVSVLPRAKCRSSHSCTKPHNVVSTK